VPLKLVAPAATLTANVNASVVVNPTPVIDAVGVHDDTDEAFASATVNAYPSVDENVTDVSDSFDGVGVPDHVELVYDQPDAMSDAFTPHNQFVPDSAVNAGFAPVGDTPVEDADFTNDDPEANSKNVTTAG
jgi:hypothetical protein